MLVNSEQYRPLLNNQIINHLGINYPYIRYFKLIFEKLNISVSENTRVIYVPLPVVTVKTSGSYYDTYEED